MLRFLGKTSESAARSDGSIPTEVCLVGEEVLSAWELVNASQSDEEDLYSYDSDETVSASEQVSTDETEPITAAGKEDDDGDGDDDVDVDGDASALLDFVSASDIIGIKAMSVSPPMTFPAEMVRDYVARDEYCGDGDANDVDGGDYGDDDDVEDDYDFDDELVPWKLKGRFGKQRIKKMGIRKMGQRGGPKLKAKKLPYYDNRPGFAHGKLR